MILLLILHIVFSVVYQTFGDSFNVGWSIAYHFANYVTFASVYICMSKRLTRGYYGELKHYKLINCTLKMCAVYYLIIAFIELSFIGKNMEQYTTAMKWDSFDLSQVVFGVLSIIAYKVLYFIIDKKRSINLP